MSLQHETLAAGVVEEARLVPERIAVHDATGSWTYGRLLATADAVAAALHGVGLRNEDTVAVVGGRSARTVLALVGVLHAGGAYCVVDPGLPPARQALILEDLAPRAVLLVDPSATPPAGVPGDVPVLRLEEIAPPGPGGLASSPDAGAAPRAVEPSDLAYVMFTSGSTGRPKGVQIEHGSVLNMLRGYEQLAPVRDRPVGALVASPSFDVTVWEIFTTLTRGGTLYVPPTDLLTDPELLWKALCTQGVTSAYIPPALLPGLVDAAQRDGGRSALDRVLVGVEPLPRELLTRFARAVPGLRVVNGYGPTETTVVATLYLVDAGQEEEPWRRAPIGRAPANTHVAVVDAGLRPVADGEVGELVVAGAGLARGYHRRPGLAEGRFTVDPVAGHRIYRTGDHARVLPSGDIEFVGRVDGQVKIGGFRIETSEIESVLAAQTGVRRAVVFTQETEAGRRLWAAAECPADDGRDRVDASHLREALARHLPAYMLPHRILVVDALPVTSNGKVDQEALLGGATTRPEGLGVRVTPDGAREELLTAIWREVLDAPWLGVTDDFHRCGGSSLAAMRIATRIRAAGLAATAADVLSAGNVRELTRRCGNRPAPVSAAVSGTDAVTGGAEAFPLSPSQQGLWAWRELHPQSADTTVLHAVRLDGPLDEGRLRAALQKVTDRHPALRTVVRANASGDPEQHVRISADAPWSVRKVDSPAEVAAGLEQWRSHRFDIAVRAWDAELLRAADFAVLLVAADHIVFDGWSANILDAELARAYADPDAEDALPAAGPGPAARAQRSWLDGAGSSAARAFWSRELDGFTDQMVLPGPLTRPASQAPRRTAQSTAGVPDRTTAALRNVAATEGSTLFTTVLAAFKAFLSLRGLGPDNTVCVAHSGRDDAGAHDAVGYFVNLVPVRDRVAQDAAFRAYHRSVSERTAPAFRHASLPFEEMLRTLPRGGGSGVAAPARIVVAQEVGDRDPLHAAGLVLSRWPDIPMNAVYDLTLFVDETDGLRLRWVCDDAAFLEGERQRLTDGFLEFLEAVAADPDLAIGLLPATGPRERQLLEESARPVPGTARHDTTVLALFDRQVAEQPGASAVLRTGQPPVTYQQLSRRADALAAVCAPLAGGSRAPVVVVLDKSTDLVAALVATARLGRPYLPLDPGHARTRLPGLAERSGAAVVLSRTGLLEGIELPEGVATVLVDDVTGEPPRIAGEDPAGPGDLLYVMPTSGTSGTAKLVGVPHRAVVRLVHGSTTLPMDRNDRTMLVANSSFDAATLELWGPLVNGGSVVVPEPADLADPGLLCTAIAAHGVTVGFFTVTLFARMIEAEPWKLAGMRHLLVGGEAVPPALFAQAEEHIPRAALVNGYGPTENTTFSCCHRLDRDPGTLRSVPVGRSVSGSTAQVMDERLVPLPVGAVGEIVVGGAGLAVGYLNDPGLTAEKFVTRSDGADGRLYRTGDMGRLLPDGAIEYLGRRDGQVKIRGFRVETGEVEHALTAHPAVRRALALTTPDPAGGRRLVAAVEAAPAPEQPDEQALRGWLRDRVPGYLVPAQIAVFDRLPLTANGKIDQAAVLVAAAHAQGLGRQAMTHVEREVAQEWEEVLGRNPVGLDDDFFALGGDSMAVLTVCSRLARRLGRPVPSHLVFEYPSVRSLAERLSPPTAEAPSGARTGGADREALLRRVRRVRGLGARSTAPAVREQG
ncbi:non-ribosomal peptide synthetase [Streptomyces sp. NBC_00239]|uniref:non-ribosomal peptide synthetase n=1 Tax=Streptomyces sp. NBC_00239 TaxID=2903640 RepID=UPI002E2CBDDD|nr:non-ribosomal peptide synthetase [Streptomyces sp. NBC_00239]